MQNRTMQGFSKWNQDFWMLRNVNNNNNNLIFQSSKLLDYLEFSYLKQKS